MKKPVIETLLSKLDNTLRWTGTAPRIAGELRGAPPFDRKRRPLRWIPIWPIALSCALFILSLSWPPALGRVPLGVVILDLVLALGGIIVALLPVFYLRGPLGKPSLHDDEREAALRKDAFFFCLGLLACLNCLGQSFLMIISNWKNWQIAHIASAAISSLLLNATLFGTVPTLYASWNLQQLPVE